MPNVPEISRPLINKPKHDIFTRGCDSQVFGVGINGAKYVMHIYPELPIELVREYQLQTQSLGQSLMESPVEETIVLDNRVYQIVYNQVAPIRKVNQTRVGVAAWKPFVPGPTIQDLYYRRPKGLNDMFESTLEGISDKERYYFRSLRRILLQHDCPSDCFYSAQWGISRQLMVRSQYKFSPIIDNINCKVRMPEEDVLEVTITDLLGKIYMMANW